MRDDAVLYLGVINKIHFTLEIGADTVTDCCGMSDKEWGVTRRVSIVVWN